jgi:hypothetical protein
MPSDFREEPAELPKRVVSVDDMAAMADANAGPIEDAMQTWGEYKDSLSPDHQKELGDIAHVTGDHVVLQDHDGTKYPIAFSEKAREAMRAAPPGKTGFETESETEE